MIRGFGLIVLNALEHLDVSHYPKNGRRKPQKVEIVLDRYARVQI